MGFNTVALVLNDLFSSIERSPRTAAYLLSNPPMDGRRLIASDYASSKDFHRFRDVHVRFDEPPIHSQALNLMPTFHADDTHFLLAGMNNLIRLEEAGRGTDKKTGRQFVKLWLP